MSLEYANPHALSRYSETSPSSLTSPFSQMRRSTSRSPSPLSRQLFVIHGTRGISEAVGCTDVALAPFAQTRSRANHLHHRAIRRLFSSVHIDGDGAATRVQPALGVLQTACTVYTYSAQSPDVRSFDFGRRARIICVVFCHCGSAPVSSVPPPVPLNVDVQPVLGQSGTDVYTVA